MLTGYRRTIREAENPGERLAHEGGEFKTDVSNASRWLFLDLEKMDWDQTLVNAVCGWSACWKNSQLDGTIPIETPLPKIVPSSGIIGTIHGIPFSENRTALKNVVVGSILGDQQAALFGQACFQPGEAKCT